MIKIEVDMMHRNAFASNCMCGWTLLIRKKNDSFLGGIAKLDKQEISSEFLRTYLPGWENLKWRKLDIHAPFFPEELVAECGDYKLNIILPAESKKPKHVVKSEFCEFMQG